MTTWLDAKEILDARQVLDDSLELMAKHLCSADASYNISTTQRWIVSDAVKAARGAVATLKKHGAL